MKDQSSQSRFKESINRHKIYAWFLYNPCNSVNIIPYYCGVSCKEEGTQLLNSKKDGLKL